MTLSTSNVMSIALEESELRVTIGDPATGVGEMADLTMWGTDGFYSRPKPPDADGACQVLWERSGPKSRIIATKDNRIIAKYGDMADGDRAIVGYGDARFIIKDASDSITLLTKNHADNDETMLVQLSGKNGELCIMIGGADGTTLIKAKSGMIHFSVDQGGALTIDKDGVHINGNTFDCATGGGNLGTIAGVPPVPGVNAVTMGAVGQTAVGSSKWTVAP